jgi:acetolactate synthase-1/2/3 large subunit
MIKVSDYLVQELKKCGVKTYFGVQGGAIAHVIESSAKKAEYVPVFNEQSAGLSAHGYYFANNKPAATLVTTGPGFLNSVTGLAACYYDNVPAVFITGQVSKELNQAEKFKMKMYGFQEVPHLEIGKKIASNIFNINSETSLVKFVKYLKDSNYKISSTILIQIQDAFSRKKINIPKFHKHKNKVIKNNLSLKNELNIFFKQLLNARKPVLIVGAGFEDLKSKTEITDFSKKFNIPLTSTWGGSPFIEKNNKLYLGYFGTHSPGLANKKISDADLVICVGASLLQHQCGKNYEIFAKKSKIIYINNNQNYLNRIKIDFGKRVLLLKSDSSHFIKECLKTKIKKSFQFNNGSSSDYVFKNASKPVQILDKIFDAYAKFKTKKRKIAFSDAGATLSWSFQAANISKTVNLITSYNLHTMGYSLPAAIGASLKKDNYALALIGDGGFLMNCQELANFCRAKNNLKMVIIDNKGYGIIRQTQDDFFKSNYVGTKISLKNNLAEYNPANICKSFNVRTLSKNENIKKSDLDKFFKSDYKCLVISVSHKYRVPYTYPKNKEVPFFY